MTMLAFDAARRWKQTWEHGWPLGDVDAIAALYAPGATYRALAFRQPDRGVDGVRGYLRAQFGVERDVTCWFGEPITSGTRAAVEWWASWTEGEQQLSLAGVTLLRFDDEGLVVDHRDYWNEKQDRIDPYEDW